MISDVLFSSDNSEWETPDSLYNWCNRKFGPIEIDFAATAANSKCKQFFDIKTNALKEIWGKKNKRTIGWLNPPYGRNVGKWIKRACLQSMLFDLRVVCLLPSRTDTIWFHDYVINRAAYIIFLKGRIRFKNAKSGAPFPSMIVVYDESSNKNNCFGTLRRWK